MKDEARQAFGEDYAEKALEWKGGVCPLFFFYFFFITLEPGVE